MQTSNINGLKVHVFDNGGSTIDRYTIILPDGEMFAASSEPFHPQGFGQYCGNIAHNYYYHTVGAMFLHRIEEEDKKHYNRLIKQAVKEQITIAKKDNHWLGKEINISALPEQVQKYITQLQN